MVYDIKGPIKGRARKKSLRRGRTLRILGDEKETSELDGERSQGSNKKQKEISEQSGKVAIQYIPPYSSIIFKLTLFCLSRKSLSLLRARLKHIGSPLSARIAGDCFIVSQR